MSFVPPTEEEKLHVESLRNQLFSEFPDLATNSNFSDTTILRFFRGHKGKEASALGGLKRYIKWRADEDVDTIEDRKHEFQKELDGQKCVLGSFDLNGRPASFCFAHRHNASDRNIEEVRKLTIYSLECLRKAAKPDEERFVIAFDLGQFTLKCMDYEAVKQLIQILQSHYPDTLESLYLLDSPMLFSACWMIIKPWIDPVTANKVQFIKRAQLTKYFDPASIPTEPTDATKADTK